MPWRRAARAFQKAEAEKEIALRLELRSQAGTFGNGRQCGEVHMGGEVGLPGLSSTPSGDVRRSA